MEETYKIQVAKAFGGRRVPVRREVEPSIWRRTTRLPMTVAA